MFCKDIKFKYLVLVLWQSEEEGVWGWKKPGNETREEEEFLFMKTPETAENLELRSKWEPRKVFLV